ncbi:MAG: bifunctional heptose 7-phosphate kinase/heptose 1-phosphate adenyltransferase [Pyrinomonadaceae bacterium]
MLQTSTLASVERLIEIAGSICDRRMLVIGDLIADQFLYGQINRVSREAPVLILHHERTVSSPGGAANCAMNLAALGARVEIIGAVGSDEPGRVLSSALREAKINCDRVVSDDNLNTTTKVRIFAGHSHSPKQQVIRVDYEGKKPLPVEIRQQLLESALTAAKTTDAVVISDYGYGIIDDSFACSLRNGVTTPVFVDSRFQLGQLTGFTSATPNEDEVENLWGSGFTDDAELEKAVMVLRKRLGLKALLVTRGSKGMLLAEEGRPFLHIPAVGSNEPIDVTGAGDTVIAAYSLALAAGASFAEAAQLANHAGGIVVMKRGTSSVTLNELVHSIKSLGQ